MIKLAQGNILDDHIGFVELVAINQFANEFKDKYNIDQMPLLAARVSTNRDDKTGAEPEKDKRLVEFLAKNKHMTPFEHQTFTFVIEAPIMVFREWHRHRTQSYNEFSMRYSGDMVGKFYWPRQWRLQDTKNKQGSSGELDGAESQIASDKLIQANVIAKKAYDDLMKMGIAKELCRLVVPVNNYSKMYVTANLRNWKQFWDLRIDTAAQWEIRQYAKAIGDILASIVPDTWAALTKYKSVDLTKEQIQIVLDNFRANGMTDDKIQDIIAAFTKAYEHG